MPHYLYLEYRDIPLKNARQNIGQNIINPVEYALH